MYFKWNTWRFEIDETLISDCVKIFSSFIVKDNNLLYQNLRISASSLVSYMLTLNEHRLCCISHVLCAYSSVLCRYTPFRDARAIVQDDSMSSSAHLLLDEKNRQSLVGRPDTQSRHDRIHSNVHRLDFTSSFPFLLVCSCAPRTRALFFEADAPTSFARCSDFAMPGMRRHYACASRTLLGTDIQPDPLCPSTTTSRSSAGSNREDLSLSISPVYWFPLFLPFPLSNRKSKCLMSRYTVQTTLLCCPLCRWCIDKVLLGLTAMFERHLLFTPLPRLRLILFAAYRDTREELDALLSD